VASVYTDSGFAIATKQEPREGAAPAQKPAPNAGFSGSKGLKPAKIGDLSTKTQENCGKHVLFD
jgi:hypothetical protein